MKGKISKILIIILFIVGFGILAYPTISNEWNTYVQSTLISDYSDTVSDMTEEDFSDEWAAARAYNAAMTENSIGVDVFGSGEDTSTPNQAFYDSEYYSVLNVQGDGTMGYLSIPKINIKLPIMHGTYDNVLQTSLGHMTGTGLPIGGESTHSVICGHRGLPSSKLFTDIDQLEEGDKFYIHVLDETLAYQVDQIMPMVEADDIETLSQALAIEDGQDYVTLFTCTPYGVNTHRLLVRGTRVDYNGEDEPATGTQAVVEVAKNYYLFFTIAGLIVAIILIAILRLIFGRRSKKDGGNH